MPEAERVIQLIPTGTEVRAGPNRDIKAHVLSISIGHDRIGYELVYWSGAERRTGWFEEFEFEPAAPCLKQLFGFQQQERPCTI